MRAFIRLRQPASRGRWWALAAGTGLALVVGPSLAAQPSRASPQPTFPGQADLVTVDAVVLDKQGQPVRGLEAGDFAVFEEGRAQAIASFEAVEG